MLKSSEDIAFAFFESLIIEHRGINDFKEVFFGGIEESFIATYRCDKNPDVIHVNDFDDYGNSIKDQFNFNEFLELRLVKEKNISKGYIKSRASKILSNTVQNTTFFNFTENILIDLNKRSNIMRHLSINDTIVDLMKFYYSGYSKYHNFSKEYLDILSVYRKVSKKDITLLSFNWRDENKQKEIEYLYNSLVNARPPFINASLQTFYKAFTNQKLEEDETIKWLCKSVKNKKIISQVSLVHLLNGLFSRGFITSDLNDFNKTVENIFSSPNGVKLKNIKVTKKETSKNPSRIQEIQAILDSLSKIA